MMTNWLEDLLDDMVDFLVEAAPIHRVVAQWWWYGPRLAARSGADHELAYYA